MEVQEITFTTTNKQVHMLEALAKIAGVRIDQALRAAVYLGLEKVLEERAENDSDDILTVHYIDKMLAVEQAGAVDTSNEDAIADLIRKHENIEDSIAIENMKA